MTTARTYLPESQMGPAERLLDVVLSSSAHLWHNRPGIDQNGTWVPAKNQTKNVRGKRVAPGLFVPAAVALYSRLLEIHKLNADLMAHLPDRLEAGQRCDVTDRAPDLGDDDVDVGAAHREDA